MRKIIAGKMNRGRGRPKRGVGYQARDKGTHRLYNWGTSIARYKRTGKWSYRNGGLGHRAGEEWGRKKQINPDSTVTKYSKNSPSFDEGVYQYKEAEKAKKVIAGKMKS